MIPVSVGDALAKYIRQWAMKNENLCSGVYNFDDFLKWERGALEINLQCANDWYYKKFIYLDTDKYCEMLAEKLKEPVAQFLTDADFTSIKLHIGFRYVGRTYSRDITVKPNPAYPMMRVKK